MCFEEKTTLANYEEQVCWLKVKRKIGQSNATEFVSAVRRKKS